MITRRHVLNFIITDPVAVYLIQLGPANAAVFLASDEAQYVTALIMPVDGGLSAQSG